MAAEVKILQVITSTHLLFKPEPNSTACASFTEEYSCLYFAYRRFSDFSSPAVDSVALQSGFGCTARLCFKTFSQWEPHNHIHARSNYWPQQNAIYSRGQSLRFAVQLLKHCLRLRVAEIQQGTPLISVIANLLINDNCEYCQSCLDTFLSFTGQLRSH